MSDKLKPLSEAEAKEFEGRRETAAVVQHRCAGCSAWYETDKRDREFQETFVCDCGNRMTFTVPAIDGVRPLSNAERFDLLGARLDSGMKPEEAVRRASAWWDHTGRYLVHSEQERRVIEGDPDQDAVSTLLLGQTWDLLDRRAKILIVKCWHHFNVRKPDLIGGADDPFKPQDRKEIN